VAFFIRPEAIIIDPDAGLDHFNRLRVTIRSVLFDGANSRLLAAPVNGASELMIALPQNRQYDHLAAGDRVDIGWSAHSANCFKIP
jgi:spermidine/putrescine transport system ATP-binding protein